MDAQLIENSQNQAPYNPRVGAFTIQCACCSKWRFTPSVVEYERIRENILKRPFFCEAAKEWWPGISCAVISDITEDRSRLWLTDMPNIPMSPPGWQRLLKIRRKREKKFADVYYFPPSTEMERDEKLRSMNEVESFLKAHPEYVEQGINLSQFSFTTPKLSGITPKTDVGDQKMIILSLPSQGVIPDTNKHRRACSSLSLSSIREDLRLSGSASVRLVPLERLVRPVNKRYRNVKKRSRLRWGVSTGFES